MVTVHVYGDPYSVNGLYEHVLLRDLTNYQLERDEKVLTLSFKKEEAGIDLLTDCVVDYIFNTVEVNIIRELIDYEYGDFLRQDEHWIISRVKQTLNDRAYHKVIREEIVELLSTKGKERKFDINGFLVFRLRTRVLALHEAVIAATEEYLIGSEEINFVKNFKHMVSLQLPKSNRLDVLVMDDGDYELILNQEGRINKQDLEDVLHEQNQNYPGFTLTREDVVLSTIFTISPREIIIHVEKGYMNDFIEMLLQVYEERAKVCEHCDLCKQFRELFEEEDE